ncbi:MAG TPA: hypothetical protein VKV30_01990 [Candidatus Angelobacter sp.]|nr:hypothetical protein [Candidatus Angelobacter sp.]
METRRGLWISGALLTAAGEIWFHWLASVNPYVLGIYLTPDRGGKYFIGGCIDTVAPAAFLGVVNGWVGFPKWSLRKVLLVASGLAVFIVAMLPLYSNLVGKQNLAIIWGYQNNVSSYVFPVVSTFAVLGFFSYGSYVFRRDWKRQRM